jgi:hypothetical protein
LNRHCNNAVDEVLTCNERFLESKYLRKNFWNNGFGVLGCPGKNSGLCDGGYLNDLKV